MKRTSTIRTALLLALIAPVALGVTACGGSAADPATESSAEAETETTKVETAEAPDTEESFADGVLTTPEVTIKITDQKVIPVGAAGNEYGDVPVIAFWFDITNNSDRAVDTFEWIYLFNAFQDNDPNVVNELDVASAPDAALVDTQDADIKKGATIQGAVAYELDDTVTPVELVASSDLGMTEIGRQVFELQ